MRTVLMAVGMAVLIGGLGSAQPSETRPIGAEALTAFDRLPLLADWPAYQDSSYSRERKNADAGNFIRVEASGEKVMVDTDGPGVIYRIWSTGITGLHLSPETRVRFYFDAEEKPRLDLSAAELFGDKGAKWPFVQPLSRTFESGRGDLEGPASICYVPIPFARHIKITTNNVAFYHVNYIKYPVGAPIESFTVDWAEKNRSTLEKAAAMFVARGQVPGPPNEPLLLTEGPVDVPPGQTAVLYEGAGPAVIRALRVRLERTMNQHLRGLVLRIQYEGSGVNSVEVPLGDFFGVTSAELRYRSVPMGATDAGYYCYFPMPFRQKIQIQVRNDTTLSARLFRSIAVEKVPVLPSSAGYFHAAYHQDKNPPMRQDYTILNVSGGRGKFVGCTMFMQGGPGTEAINFLEGDETIYVDEEQAWPTRWVGTGTEDYFNGSFYWNGIRPEDMHQAFGGLILRHDGMRRICAYRWHIPDFISFRNRIKVDIEHGPESDFPSDYSSVAYWYMEKPVAAPALPPFEERIPRSELPAPVMMGCRFEGPFTSNGPPVEERWLRAVDKEYLTDVYPEGLAPKRMQWFCSLNEIGQEMTGKLFVPGEDRYNMTVFLSGGPRYGLVVVLVDDRPVRTLNAYNETFVPARGFDLGMVPLAGGEHKLTFRAVGRDVMATGMDVGVVAWHCSPTMASTIRKWLVIGPWQCQEQGGWAQVNPPETEQNPDATYDVTITRQGKPVQIQAKWQPVDLPPGAGVTSCAHFGWDSWQVCYGLTYIWSPKDQTVGAFIAKDDGIAIWVNGQKVLDNNTWSHYLSDQFIAACPLKSGWNTMLVKNCNWHGAWGWAIRLTDPNQELKFSNTPPTQ